MTPLVPRMHLFEIDDQPWQVNSSASPTPFIPTNSIRFPSFLRARVQAALTVAWTTHVRPPLPPRVAPPNPPPTGPRPPKLVPRATRRAHPLHQPRRLDPRLRLHRLLRRRRRPHALHRKAPQPDHLQRRQHHPRRGRPVHRHLVRRRRRRGPQTARPLRPHRPPPARRRLAARRRRQPQPLVRARARRRRARAGRSARAVQEGRDGGRGRQKGLSAVQPRLSPL